MNRSIVDSPIVKILAVLLFLGAIAAWMLWPQHMPPPDEANRYRHPDGYSIIRPAGWEGGPETHMMDASMLGRISAHPLNISTRTPSFAVTNLRESPDLKKLKADEHFVDADFQGHPALMSEGKGRFNWQFRMIWKDQDRWFRMEMTVPIQEDIMHSDWAPYLQSFRYDPRAATHQTTMPTTATFEPIFPTSAP